MKYFITLGFIGFMAVSVYLLLNENKLQKNTKSKTNVSKSNHTPPYMLQRDRIENISIFTFESNDSGVTYKINEEQLDDFANQVKELKQAQPAEVK